MRVVNVPQAPEPARVAQVGAALQEPDAVDVPMRSAQAPLRPTDEPIRPATISEMDAKRILRGVNQEKPCAASHARMPVTPAAAVAAPTMH